jgi:hypothetical protein
MAVAAQNKYVYWDISSNPRRRHFCLLSFDPFSGITSKNGANDVENDGTSESLGNLLAIIFGLDEVRTNYFQA